MIKKISAGELRPGMYIHDLNCGWMDHPFASKRFKVDSLKVVEKVRAIGIHELYIDTSKGLDLIHAPTESEAAEARQADLERLADKAAKAA